MHFTEFFIRRAITTTLLMAALSLFGAIAYLTLPVSDLPNIDFPTIQVSVNQPGASPETMANTVATPLEREFTSLQGIASINSSSSLGSTRITLEFDLSRNIDAAAQDVQAAISSASRDLPQNLPRPPTFRKVNPAESPVIFIGLSSATLPLSEVDEYAQVSIAQRISTVNGVAQVDVYGSQKYAVRVQVDPNALAARSIGIDEVRNAISQNNSNLPAGSLQGSQRAFTLDATGQLTSAEQFRPVIVTYRNGRPVRLDQIARVVDSVENKWNASWFNGERSILLAVQRQPGTNTVEIVDGIKALLPAIQDQMPAGMNIGILFDRSEPIRESIHDVKFTLWITIMLVIAVIFVFLRNPSATIIPSLAVPISILGTFVVMSLLGYTLDNLSAMALTLCVGFVVDDAIVVLENIVRHREMGKGRMEAAIDGTKEITFTIISMTLSLVAVFIPVLFMGGIVGRLLQEFAVVISVAILVSGVVSLTLTPMLASRFLSHKGPHETGRLFKWSERQFDRMVRGYERSLHWALKGRLAMLLLSFVLIGVTGWLFAIIPKGFFPTEDTGFLMASTEAAEDTSFEQMMDYQQRVADVVARNPYVAAYQSSAGGGPGGGGTNQGRVFIRLKKRSERPGAEEISQQIRGELMKIPGVNTFVQVPPAIRLGGNMSRSLYQFTLQDTDIQRLYTWSPRIEQALTRVPGLLDVTSDLRISSPQITVEIDRDKARTLGLTATDIENVLYDAFGQRQVSTIFTASNQYYVILELLPEYQTDPNALSRLYVRNPRATTPSQSPVIPLNSIARLRQEVAPVSVSHYGQLPAVTISFNTAPGVSLGQAVERIEDAMDDINAPATITTTFQGTAQAFQESLRNTWVLLVAAILVIYLVLGVLYESYIHPITILSGLPSAALGALLTLLLFGIDLNIYAIVGILLLVGIVKKNAIMMIDFALEAQRMEGKPPAEAIFQGAVLRFRPIMMTTLAALLGTLPIALGLGAGAEARRPLGLAVVGGLLVSQVITLYLTPVMYIYMESAQKRVRNLTRRVKPGKPERPVRTHEREPEVVHH
ncbi:MAG TPA: efflux RND transporter permease subunit [Bryobacteraceae bacterium]|nr:efflux RND transporter permease subunit [Bryobacteraceae bacterium]